MMNFTGQTSQSLTFDSPGDKLSFFDMKVGQDIGKSTITLSAKSGVEKSQETIELEIRNPNPIITKVKDFVLTPGEEQSLPVEFFGTSGTNAAVLEVSNALPFNLDKRLKYLIRYPYGCIEQTTSAIFPQLYLAELMNCLLYTSPSPRDRG